MRFLDQKEEVLDIQLTQFGKYKLSVGEFNPTYYAFFDGDILYDPDCAELSGSQNSIEPRIQEETPRLQAQHVFEGRETTVLRGNEIMPIPSEFSRGTLSAISIATGAPPSVAVARLLKNRKVINTLNGDVIVYPDAQAQQLQAYYQQNVFQKYQYMVESTTREKQYSFVSPLGTSEYSKQKAPHWSVTLLSGEITGTETFITGAYQTEQIPQVNVTLNFETMVANSDSSKNLVPIDGTDPELAGKVHNDGTYIAVRPEHLLADVREINSEYENHNFDVEILEVDSRVMSGLAFGDGASGNEIPFFKYLYFEPEKVTVKDGILLDEPIDPVVKEIGDETKFASYFMDVLVDNEIDETIVCNSVSQIRAKDVRIDADYFNCPDVPAAINPSIYTSAEIVCDTEFVSDEECEV